MWVDNYFLLKLIDKLGEARGRKRLQKLVYLAKLRGCPITDQFFFHYYGPYSSDLAARVDDFVNRGLLEETPRSVGAQGTEFSYKLTEESKSRLGKADALVPGEIRGRVEPLVNELARLANREVFELELASSVLYWRESGVDLDEAASITAQMKRTPPDSDAFRRARTLAEEWAGRLS